VDPLPRDAVSVYAFYTCRHKWSTEQGEYLSGWGDTHNIAAITALPSNNPDQSRETPVTSGWRTICVVRFGLIGESRFS